MTFWLARPHTARTGRFPLRYGPATSCCTAAGLDFSPVLGLVAPFLTVMGAVICDTHSAR